MAVGVGLGVAVGLAVAVGSGVDVAVGSGVDVGVGRVCVAVGTTVATTGVMIGVAVGEAVGTILMVGSAPEQDITPMEISVDSSRKRMDDIERPPCGKQSVFYHKPPFPRT